MHELGVAQQVVELATGASAGARVRRVVVEVGALSLVLPDALRFCFELATEGTTAEGAALEIVEVPGQGRCRQCGATVPMARAIAQCPCGASDLEWLSGEELRVRSVEVD